MAAERIAHRSIGSGVSRRRGLGFWTALAIVRRLEFYVVELTIFGIPLLVVSSDFDDVLQPVVLEGLLMFFVLYSVGDMVNCLADRELDKVYKSRLSRAVYRIGPRRLGWLVGCQAVLGLSLAVHLSVTTGRFAILLLVIVGLFLGLGYSLRPLQFKGRGLGHLVCLWLLLYFIPMVCASLLLGELRLKVVVVAATYATVEMGIILVNTSEDFLEDRAAGIRTTTVRLGLPGTLKLATAMVGVGGAGFAAFWFKSFRDADVVLWGYLVVLLLGVVCATILIRLIWLTHEVMCAIESESAAVEIVKSHGPMVPVAATAVGWVGVGCALIAVLAGGG
jgi:4-hydroxybenzoate polyprenyltransferase